MGDVSFEYDVFISFASEDQELVRPLWQDLTSGGLRVFWSDNALREHVGSSWFEVIEQSLDRSRHFLLICTPTSLASKWVKREYVAFLNHCHRPPVRLLVPALVAGIEPTALPLFLRELEACSFLDRDLARRLVRAFGGVDVAALLAKVATIDEEMLILRTERDSLATELSAVRAELRSAIVLPDELDKTRRELTHALEDRDSLNLEVEGLRNTLGAQQALETNFTSLQEELKLARGELAQFQAEYEWREQCDQSSDLYADNADGAEATVDGERQMRVAQDRPEPLDCEASAQAPLGAQRELDRSAFDRGYDWRVLAFLVAIFTVATILLSLMSR